jgi:hypothetical protein
MRRSKSSDQGRTARRAECASTPPRAGGPPTSVEHRQTPTCQCHGAGSRRVRPGLCRISNAWTESHTATGVAVTLQALVGRFGARMSESTCSNSCAKSSACSCCRNATWPTACAFPLHERSYARDRVAPSMRARVDEAQAASVEMGPLRGTMAASCSLTRACRAIRAVNDVMPAEPLVRSTTTASFRREPAAPQDALRATGWIPLRC